MKINELNVNEKDEILDRLGEPFGYAYEPNQDIFVSRRDAPQKLFGYTTAYDLSAPYFNMIFDYETIYFDYNNRTWLVEMWKGQYGINSGCELGIYYADEIISPEEYDTTLFKAVESNDMLLISLKLNRHLSQKKSGYARLGQIQKRHWWPTIFKMGTFSKPEQLFVNTSIRFKDRTMLHSFMESFAETLPSTFYKINGLTVYFTFSKSLRSYSAFKKMVRRIALASCHMLCNWFNYLTRPFSNSGDKLLYLYYYLPFLIRFLFRRISK
ncbi:MAG: DUF4474 domain-containing protein [Tyzzerella sp.]|nr:DUF4474 domain-containing protein [Tyzzerella sp.]